MFKSAAILMALSFLLSAPAFSQSKMKAGLWEVTTQSSAMKNMPKIPPEQMAQMRKMGIDMSHLQTGAIVNKICITKEMAERQEVPQMNDKESGCQMKNQQSKGRGFTADMICNGPEMKGKGVIKTEFASESSFTVSSDFKGTAGGMPINDQTTTNGKWLSANCGSVKPLPRSGK